LPKIEIRTPITIRDNRSFDLVQAGQDESCAIRCPALFLFPFPDKPLSSSKNQP